MQKIPATTGVFCNLGGKMAQRRMFSKEITNSDVFLDMPLSAQALYFHFGMNADDDGFVSPKSIIRLVQAKDDDVKLLLTKGFIIPFEDSVIVITHWKTNNHIKKDRYKPTLYREHKKMLGLTEGKYTLYPKCIQNVSKMDTQYRLGKDSIVKDSIGNTSENEKIKTSDVVEKQLIDFLKTQETIKSPIGYLSHIKSHYGEKFLPRLLKTEFNEWHRSLDYWTKNDK